MEMGVAMYYLDALRLMLQSFDSYSNVLAVKTFVSQYFYHKM